MMRILLATMFFVPLAAMFAVSKGAETVLPTIIGLMLVAIVAQIVIERRQRGA